MTYLQSLVDKANIISIKGFKSELGYNTERCELSNVDECYEWMDADKRNTIEFCHGSLWGDDSDLDYTVFHQEDLTNPNSEYTYKGIGPDDFGGSDY